MESIIVFLLIFTTVSIFLGVDLFVYSKLPYVERKKYSQFPGGAIYAWVVIHTKSNKNK